MPVQSHRGGWRARKKYAGQWFRGPVRQSAQVAEEDQRKLDTAAAVSLEALRERCQNLVTTNSQEKMDTVERCRVMVERRSAGWRLRIGTKENRRYGLTRRDKSAAEDDARRVADALQVSQQEVDRVLRQLTEDGSGLSDDFPLQHLKVCLGQLNPPALPRRQRERYRSEASKRENAGIMRACELLVSEYQLAESLASRIDARWLYDMGLQWRLDSGSRPLGTGGFDNAAPISGLRNLGNSCWLNSILQCFLHCGPLARDLLDQTCEKGPLRHWMTATLVKLRSRDFDYVAPFELLHQMYLTRADLFPAGESADTADAVALLLEKTLSQHSLVAPRGTDTGHGVKGMGSRGYDVGFWHQKITVCCYKVKTAPGENKDCSLGCFVFVSWMCFAST